MNRHQEMREVLNAAAGALFCACLVAVVFALLIMLSSCSTEVPHGIQLGPRERIEVSPITHKAAGGIDVSTYHCGVAVLYCEKAGVRMECECRSFQ